ncbi:SH3 domain-containing protein [Sulfitobacter sp. D35]|uniref:SH3 domain-containing protein n=1 Tax=Sulfitobacter sp. D35 TaxID=3083252 RepID=UPI00296FE928|nr:SH3 domain-containing protein [Sulfitobacter sp. D35]MDW4498498.1 SH3 domain-containing protein [Sulfitobacter sp. D35]
MRRVVSIALAVGVLASVLGSLPASAGWRDRYEVHGVEDGDMLKMRWGPGTEFVVVLGLPNGTVLRVHECQQTGGTRWCKVSLNDAPRMKGYVSWAYLREI